MSDVNVNTKNSFASYVNLNPTTKKIYLATSVKLFYSFRLNTFYNVSALALVI